MSIPTQLSPPIPDIPCMQTTPAETELTIRLSAPYTHARVYVFADGVMLILHTRRGVAARVPVGSA
jgi:hypothetical protein